MCVLILVNSDENVDLHSKLMHLSTFVYMYMFDDDGVCIFFWVNLHLRGIFWNNVPDDSLIPTSGQKHWAAWETELSGF